MRLTGGLDRGRRLKAPRGLKTRPTAAKVREAIFNILGPPPEAVLDLYAGTGALGLEALSRGATTGYFVENDPRALAALHRNLKEGGFAERTTVIGRDVRKTLRLLSEGDHAGTPHFGWVFVDPPYAGGLVEATLNLIGCSLLADGAVVLVEHDKHHEPPATCGALNRTDLRYYGDTGLSFYRCHGSLS